MNALRVEDMDTFYGRIQILHDVTMEVPEGRITAVIGPNGAGKSTALKAMFGLVGVARGRVLLHDKEMTNSSPRAMVQAGVCFVPQGRAVFPSLSVRENLRMGAYTVADADLERRRAADVFARFPALAERADQAAGSLSGGEQQMLAIGRALMADPQVMLLDEPSVGLAPHMVNEILTTLEALRDEGRTLVIVEQNATAALQTADQAYLLVRGRIAKSGPAKALLGDAEVRRLYLGG